jgi:hypothetical protein
LDTVKQSQIEAWILNDATGKFHYTKVLDGLISKELYPQLRVILRRCKEKGIAAPVPGEDGWWRPVDHALDELEWWNINVTNEETIRLPLGLNKYCVVRKPALIIVAGKYNAGKSTFCLNVVKDNIELWGGNLDFYVSEGAETIKEKFALLGVSDAPAFRTYRRTENFADVLNPNSLSVIDYLRVDMTQTYAVSEKLFEIFNKVNQGNGIAVVAMQKPPGERKLAFGGASTAFEPTLYLGMESTGANSGWIGFEKIKIIHNNGIDPYTLKIHYTIDRGSIFKDHREEINI